VERAAQADSLRELSVTMVSDTDIKDVFRLVVDHAVQMTLADRVRYPRLGGGLRHRG